MVGMLLPKCSANFAGDHPVSFFAATSAACSSDQHVLRGTWNVSSQNRSGPSPAKRSRSAA